VHRRDSARSGQNANVFYEVGYAHALNKPCTLITKNSEDIPFDLKQHRHVIYGSSVNKLKNRLELEFKKTSENININKNESITFTLDSAFGDLTIDENFAYANVTLKIEISNATKKRSPEIDSFYLHTGLGWTFTINGETLSKSKSDISDYQDRHFIRSPVPRISPNATHQISLNGTKLIASTLYGDEIRESYKMNGHFTIEAITPEKKYQTKISVNLELEEFPF
jgi:hypothetical protein